MFWTFHRWERHAPKPRLTIVVSNQENPGQQLKKIPLFSKLILNNENYANQIINEWYFLIKGKYGQIQLHIFNLDSLRRIKYRHDSYRISFRHDVLFHWIISASYLSVVILVRALNPADFFCSANEVSRLGNEQCSTNIWRNAYATKANGTCLPKRKSSTCQTAVIIRGPQSRANQVKSLTSTLDSEREIVLR